MVEQVDSVTAGTAVVTTEVIRAKCCGYGVCWEICPEVFQLDDSGIAVVEVETVPVELLAKVKEAAAACPERAILVNESD